MEKDKERWAIRRKVVFTSMAFAMCVIGYISWNGHDTELNQSIIDSAFLFLGAVVCGYCGFAVWDDKNPRNDK